MSALLKQCLYSPGLRDCRALRSCSETGARAVRSGCCLPLTETKWFPPSWWFLLGNLTRLTKLLPEKMFIYVFFFVVMNDYFQKLLQGFGSINWFCWRKLILEPQNKTAKKDKTLKYFKGVLHSKIVIIYINHGIILCHLVCPNVY